MFTAYYMLALVFGALAQKSHRLDLSGGIASVAMRDRGMSPLQYMGLGVSSEVMHTIQGAQSTQWFAFMYAQSGLTNTHNNPISFRSFQLNAGSVWGVSDTVLGSGWGFLNRNQFVYINNPSLVNFNERSYYYTSFGPAYSYRRQFTFLSLPLTFYLPVDFQLLGFYIEPSYTSNIPEGFIDHEGSWWGAFLGSVQFLEPFSSSIGGFSPELYYKLISGQRIGLQYHFQFVRLGSTQKFTSVMGNGHLTLSITL